MNKGVTVEQNKLAIQKTMNHDMQVMAYIMFGYPGETRQTLEETLEMLLSTDILAEDVSIFFTIPLPGTRLYEDCVKKGLITDEQTFLSQLYDNIHDQYDRYFIQLGGLSRRELVGFEKKLIFLLAVRKYISINNPLFMIIKKIVTAIPDKSRANILFSEIYKILRKTEKFFIHK